MASKPMQVTGDCEKYKRGILTPGHTDDFALVLKRAREGGVEKIIITGTNLEESKEAIETIQNNDEGMLVKG